MVLNRTLEEGASLSAQEFRDFLYTRGIARRYIEVLKILINPSRWSEVNGGPALPWE